MNKESVYPYILILVVFLIDLLIPLGVAVGVLYICCISLLIRSDKNEIFLVSIISSVLIIIIPIFTFNEQTTWMAFVNRGISLLAIIIFCLIAIKHKKLDIENDINIINIKGKNEELENFAYRSSHDLKAPLATIQGYVKIAKYSLEDDNKDEVNDFLNKINTTTLKLKNLVSNILNLSKASAKDELNVEIDFDKMHKSITENLNHYLRHMPIKIFTHFNHVNKVYAQETRMHQVIENLLSNAIKYQDKSKKNSYVSITTRDLPNTSFEIVVEDNGLGVPDKFQDRIFSMFCRAHKESVDGSGLGLYIVKRHIEKMGGEIKVNSVETKGTTFTIIIPNKPC